MKTRIQNIARGILFVLITFFGVQTNRASTTDTTFTQDFSNSTFPPAGWTDDSYDEKTGGPGWLHEVDGLYGTTGSALCDIADGSTGFLLTPQIDASRWSGSGDSAFVDFDFFWEYNYNNQEDGTSIDDNFQVYVVNSSGQQQVLNLFTTHDNTYFNPSYSAITDPPTDQSAWRHYHIAIPAGYRTTGLRIAWQDVPNFGAGNAAIDNVAISGTRSNVLTITPTSQINFGSVYLGDTSARKTVYLSNPNPVAINISNITTSDKNFHVAYAPSSIAAGTWANPRLDSIILFYTPRADGVETGALSFNTSGDQPNSNSISLTGTGISPQLPPPHIIVTPANFEFPPIQVGYQECQLFTVTNPGKDSVEIISNSLQNSDYDFSFVGLIDTDRFLAAGQSRSVTVCFTPIRTGTRVATLQIAVSTPATGSELSTDTSIVLVQISGIGSVREGLVFSMPKIDTAAIGTTNCMSDTLWNLGKTAATVTSGGFSGVKMGNFSFADQTFPVTIPAGSFSLISVCYTPAGRELDSALATVYATTSEDSMESASTVIIGQGGMYCQQQSTSELFNSTKTLIGTSDTQTVTITNCGDFATSFTGMLSDPKNYSIVGSATTGVIQPSGTANFTIAFTPSERTTYVASLNVTGSEGLEPIIVKLLGTGGGVTAIASGEPGNVELGNCQNFIVTLINQGNMDWTPNAPTITDANFADYTIVSQPPETIAAGDSGTMTIEFCPTSDDCEDALLTFPNSSPATQPEFTYILTGMSVSAGVTQSASSNGFVLGQNYPNPAQDMATIAFTTPTDCQVQLNLIDGNGAIVQTITMGHYSSGDHLATIDVHSLASGTYFCQLSSGNVNLIRQIEVVK